MSHLMDDRWDAAWDNFPEEEIIDLKNTVSLPVYTVTDGSHIDVYCNECQPANGQPGTFITSSYDNFCTGCGRDFKEIAEEV